VHRRPQHGDRLLVHDVTEVVGRRLQGGIVEIELAAQVFEVIAQRLPERGESPPRLEGEQRCSTCEPLAEIAARNAPSHMAPPWSVVRSISAPYLNELPHAAFAAPHDAARALRSCGARTAREYYQSCPRRRCEQRSQLPAFDLAHLRREASRHLPPHPLRLLASVALMHPCRGCARRDDPN
jgi:hypothetical protein